MASEIKLMRQYLNEERKKYGDTYVEIPRAEWTEEMRTLAEAHAAKAPIKVWRNRWFLAQLFRDPSGYVRLSVNRAEIDSNGMWKDGITWDDLMAAKHGAGLGDRWCVEVYPPDAKVVNVSNIRHLFVLADAPEFGWGAKD